jgi:hypothetical protein
MSGVTKAQRDGCVFVDAYFVFVRSASDVDWMLFDDSEFCDYRS